MHALAGRADTTAERPSRAASTAAATADAPRRHVDPDLGKLHAARQYNRHTLRAKVPWYRNSFEDTETIPITSVPQMPALMDPPFEIPTDLRPLGCRRRYLRTIQLITDPVPGEVCNTAAGGSASKSGAAASILVVPASTKPFEKTLRFKDPQRVHASTPKGVARKQLGQKDCTPHRMLRSTSHANGLALSREEAEQPYVRQSDPSLLEGRGGLGDLSSHHEAEARRRETTLGPVRSLGKLMPLTSLSDSAKLTVRGCRERSRKVSVEEAGDLSNSDFYFGPQARSEFFSQYRNLYSKPYLFVEDSELRIPRGATVSDSEEDAPSTGSKFVPAYPSSSYLKGVDHDLSLVGSGIEHGEGSLPTEDKLSPRSQFLTACVTRPYMAVPFMMRKGMTKVFDFSFQSLGDEFIIEFSKSIMNDLPFVEEINVRDNRLSDHGLNSLLQAIAHGSSMLHLHRLDISQNEIGAKSALTLRSYVVSSHCSLKMLLVDNADIDDNECAAFMTAFEKNLSIKMLWMSRNSIGKSENLNVVQPQFTTGGEAIASMLHANLVLAHLDMSWNYLRLESGITLAKSLLENRTLLELNLAHNACNDPGAMMFGEALRFNQCLEVLDLSYNSIGCKGALVLANALRVNRTLRSLQLNGNNIGREGGQQLMFALCENKNERGCDLGLHACNLSTSVVYRAPPPSSLAKIQAGAPGSTAAAMPITSAQLAEFNVSDFPMFGSSSSCVFNPKEPTGRYLLNLLEPYDRMMAMELARLATMKKGCRFLRVEHRPSTASAKRIIQLTRKERKLSSLPSNTSRSGSIVSAAGGIEGDHPIDTLGLGVLFADFDADHSGSIDGREVMNALNRVGLFPKMENLAIVMEKFDFNCSGYPETGQDFSAFFFHAVFQLIDSDNSGKIDADEIEEAFVMLGIDNYDEKEILEAIAMYDITGDGEMEESEFVEFMKDRLLERIKLQLLMTSAAAADDGVPFVTLIDSVTQKQWVVPDDGLLEIDFVHEREAFSTTEEAHRYSKLTRSGIELLIRNIMDLADSKSEQEELFHVAIHDSEIKFTASQAYQVLEACGNLKPVDKKIESIAMILPQMLTAKDAQVLVSRTLTLRQRCRLKAEMGSAYSVIMGNPTAHYSFDLAKQKDRAALSKIAEVAQSEKQFSKHKSGRADTSQHGNWENFRNEELDGVKFVLTSSFFHVLPSRGKLAFDYVSTTRPKRGTLPLSERRFQQLIQELQMNINLHAEDDNDEIEVGDMGHDHGVDGFAEVAKVSTVVQEQAKTIGNLRPPPLSKSLSARTKQTEFWDKMTTSVLKKGWQFLATNPQATTFRFTNKNTTKENVALKLVQIESAICDRWISCEQAAQIIACMPTSFHARPETARILFARLIDVGNFYQIVDAMPQEDQYVCAKSLGWLNMFNPMAPERFYSFDLSIWDEREMTKLLVQLAINEPGENWINQNFSMVRGEPGIPGWKLPVRWEKEDEKDGGGVNRAGFLDVEYYSGEDRGCAAVPTFRTTLLACVLAGTKQYCL